jgi:hypothetical protein
MGADVELERELIAQQYFEQFPMSLTIGYLNVEGLRMEKHQACCSLMDSALFDVLFLSETWFPKAFNYMFHPYSFLHTVRPKVPDKTRQSGGILAMVSSQIIPRINSYHQTANGIFLDIDGIKLLAVYLPPSLSLGEIEDILLEFSDYDLLFEDVNVRFKDHSKSKNLSPRILQDFWLDWLMCNSFTIASPRTEEFLITAKHKSEFNKSYSPLLCSRFPPTVGTPYVMKSNCELDHLFHSGRFKPGLQLLGSKQFNIKTVHPYFLRFSIPFTFLASIVHQIFGRFH